ncbi:hypothetical protein PIB30_073970 [Stylosanthes scabra]|uniref:Uncharacterized protein n=1 Tax=Stylosanthes scabra TaxID=79078 RepID=A0ABU6VSX1_9FABA|nr:hypothetical protein [Stylosanthes scabra]
MAPKSNEKATKKSVMMMNRGAWTPEEDDKLAHFIQIHGAKRWKTVAIKSGLKRCGKSCRLRWLNYLRPNIKRGNITIEEEDLILRLHKLLGNRWSLIAGRLPGRTDNEIKNYWNSHLCKKVNQNAEEKPSTSSTKESGVTLNNNHDNIEDSEEILLEEHNKLGASNKNGSDDNLDISFDVNEFFDFSTTEESFGFDWINKYLDFDESHESTKEKKNDMKLK